MSDVIFQNNLFAFLRFDEHTQQRFRRQMTQFWHFMSDPFSHQSHQNRIQNLMHFFNTKIKCVEFGRDVVFRITLLELSHTKLRFLHKESHTYSMVRMAPRLP